MTDFAYDLSSSVIRMQIRISAVFVLNLLQYNTLYNFNISPIPNYFTGFICRMELRFEKIMQIQWLFKSNWIQIMRCTFIVQALFPPPFGGRHLHPITQNRNWYIVICNIHSSFHPQANSPPSSTPQISRCYIYRYAQHPHSFIYFTVSSPFKHDKWISIWMCLGSFLWVCVYGNVSDRLENKSIV